MAQSLTELDLLLYPIYDSSYKSVDCYYSAMSPVRDAHLVTTPTIVVSAEDDPICCHTGAPSRAEQLGPGLAVVLCAAHELLLSGSLYYFTFFPFQFNIIELLSLLI